MPGPRSYLGPADYKQGQAHFECSQPAQPWTEQDHCPRTCHPPWVRQWPHLGEEKQFWVRKTMWNNVRMDSLIPAGRLESS